MSPQGSDLSLEDFQGQTPLHAAARRGHAAVVSLLLRSGAAVNARDAEGHSPLLLAARGRYRLRAHGAGVPCRGWGELWAGAGGKPLHGARRQAGWAQVPSHRLSLPAVGGAPRS